MGLMTSVSPATKVAENVWQADLEPHVVRSMGAVRSDEGALSVVAVLERVRCVESNGIQFNPGAVRVLAVGSTPTTLFIQSVAESSSEAERLDTRGSATGESQHGRGDEADFLRALRDAPQSVGDLGQVFIAEVRRHFQGRLERSESGRFIETPDNFWTVKIQPRDRSLAITVRGRPGQLPSPSGLELKPDRPTYSRFKIEREDQIPAAIEVLRAAPRRH